MSSIEMKRLARRIAKIEREQANMSKPQLAYSSIENGNIKSYEGDDLKMSIGLQDDGSSTMRFFDGPTPPIPAGFTALADGPLIQGTWDGSFVDGQQATYDLAYLEVAATLVEDDTRVSFATITAKEGASAALVANQSGQWAVAVRSVSQAGKKSEFFSAGTVEVKLVDLAGAIEAVQDSANGKNKVTYSDRPPTAADPGIFDDTWFVGQVGRPNDLVEATNIVTNPSAETGIDGYTGGAAVTLNRFSTAGYQYVGTYGMAATVGAGAGVFTFVRRPEIPVTPGQWLGQSIYIYANMAGSSFVRTRVLFFTSTGAQTGGAPYTSGPVDALGAWTKVSGAVQVPANAATAVTYFYMYSDAAGSAPLQGARYRFDAWAVVPASTEAGALAGIATYFDGDTPNGATPNESHYRWTGTPHASTSEKYLPALDIGDSDNWNVIEQYRHDGTGWVKVELSHYVFSTVDLGKATVGELDGIRIMAKTIGTEQLRADFADFVVARGATLIAGNDRHRLDDNGYALFDANGDRRTFLSPDGSTFKGEVEADTLVVNEGAEFKATNTLAQGAKLTLAAGVTDPTAPPVVQPFWDGMELSGALDDAVGLAWDGTNYWTAERYKRSSGAVYGMYGHRINGTTGEVENITVNLEAPVAVTEVYGITCIGSELFWLTRNTYAHRVLVTDLNGTYLRRFDFADAGHSATNPLTYEPGIGSDGTNVVIGHASDDGTLRIRTYNKTTGAQIGSTASEGNANFKGDISGVYVGTADDSTTRVYINKAGAPSVYAYTTGAVYDTTRTFTRASSSATGIVYAGGKFRTLDPSGIIHEHADLNTGDGSGDWWACYAWAEDFDGNGITETWSRPSPPTRFTWPRRAQLRIMGQPLPAGAEMILPALAKKTSTPVRTDFHSPSWNYIPETSKATYESLPTDWASKPSPRDSNNFPEAESSVLESASGTFHVDGAGTGWWGPLKVGRNGVMSGLIVSGSLEAYVDTGGTAKAFTVNLPAGRFTKPPRVWVMAGTDYPQLISMGIPPSGITTSTFRLSFYRANTTPTPVVWFAMDSE